MALKLDRKSFGSVAKGDLLVPHLDKAIGVEEFEWSFNHHPKLEDDAWHPSGDCTPTVHDLWLKATGQVVERPHSTSLRKTFMVGHFWHAYIQHIVVDRLEIADASAIERKGCKAWDDCPSGGSPKPFWWCTGSGDIAPCDIPGHGNVLVDIKTMNAHGFNAGKIPSYSADKWECQVNIYMDFFDLDRAIILGVMKDSPHDFCEFEFRRNEALIEAIYKKWKLVGLCIEDGIEPPTDDALDDLPLSGPVR